MFQKGSRHNPGGFKAKDRSPQQRKMLSSGASPGPRRKLMDREVLKMPYMDPRRIIVDHIIRDCYSKFEVVNGQKVPENKYHTHLNVREYSLYPQKPPPDVLASSQAGAVKNRILVLCTKQSGKVLLQKGKYNDEKRIYQIGRTWNFDELERVTKIGIDGVILRLNKDYYWQSGEGPERMQKFLHHLALIYHRSTGQYPQLQGVSLSDLSIVAPQRSGSVGQVETASIAPKELDLSALDRDIDFKANGKPPKKPMQVMDDDRPTKVSPSSPQPTAQTVPTVITALSTPNRNKFLHEAVSNSGSDDHTESGINENASVKSIEDKLNLASAKPKSLENVGSLLPLKNSFTFDEFKAECTPVTKPGGEKPLVSSRLQRGSAVSARSTRVVGGSAIDFSIKEIEDFMDSNFGSHKKLERDNRELLLLKKEEIKEVATAISTDNTSVANPGTPNSDLDDSHVSNVKLEKDAEIDELLDEIGWKVTDNVDTFMGQLNRELAQMKRKNVAELIRLDFGKDTLSNDAKVCSAEIANLTFVFKKMEVSIQRIAPRINDLEKNSKGLQVEAVNNKILFNELNEILDKVKVNNSDLKLVVNFNDFDNLSQIPQLELKLLAIYDALQAIGKKDSHEGLGQMKALKQYQEEYTTVAMSFVSRFVPYIHGQFTLCVEGLSQDIDNLFPRNILDSFMNLTPYVCLVFFAKCISKEDTLSLRDNFNTIMAQFLTKYFSSRLLMARYSQKRKSNPISLSFDSIDVKRRSSRFGSTRLISRLSGNGIEELNKQEALELTQPEKKTSFEPRTIMRIVQETRELILVVQFFFCNFFHSLSTDDFFEYLNKSPFDLRRLYFEAREVYLINYKTKSNELLLNMNAVFGGYIRNLVMALTPSELQVPPLLLDLLKLLAEASAQYQDFIAYSFLRKLIDRYKSIWMKFIASNASILQKSHIRAKTSLLPGIKNLNAIVLSTETTLQDSSIQHENSKYQEVFDMVKLSYDQLTDAMVDLFGREDPLLKYNKHDEKERAHSNVGILQNLFSVLQQLSEFKSVATTSMRLRLEVVFQRVKKMYLDYLLHRFFGKMMDFVTINIEDAALKKRNHKVLIKALVASHTPKEMTSKITELHHKLEKHFLGGTSVLEQDLLSEMWKDTENSVVELFQKFFAYAKSIDRDLDDCITITGIRSLFRNAR